MKSSLLYRQFPWYQKDQTSYNNVKNMDTFFNGSKDCFPQPKDNRHPAHSTSIRSYDVIRIQTKELSTLLSVYFHEVLQQLNL